MKIEFSRPKTIDDDDGDFQVMLDHVAKGDQDMEDDNWEDAETAYKSALELAYYYYGALNPVILPLLLAIGNAQLQTCQSEDYYADLSHTWQRALAVAGLKYGHESPELLPIMEKLIAVYDLQGAHMLSGELVERLQVLNEISRSTRD